MTIKSIMPAVTGSTSTFVRSDGTAATPGGGGGGAVDSVNGQTGVVVLDAADVGVIYGTATATFSNGADSVTVTVVDAGVSAGSKIVPSIAMGSRDADEMEMAPVAVAVGSITAGVGFTLIAVSLDGDAEGAYQINYTRD
jgi:hypothetical protein